MYSINDKVTKELNFYEGNSPFDIIEEYGSPLYVYNERILRERCRELKALSTYPKFQVIYSAKANSSLALLQIVREEGLMVDAMSPGEIHVEKLAGFTPEEIFYVTNNASPKEMQFSIDNKVLMSVDSLSQLEQYGKINPGSKIAVRFNPGLGVGHNEKVVTGGKNTKFGVNPEYIPEVKNILEKYSLTLVGINQHIGSLFMEGDAYVKSFDTLFEIASQFEGLEFIDLGGGFGIPYKKQENQQRLDLKALGNALDERFFSFSQKLGREITFKIEPGRYIAAECGVLFGTAYAIKNNGSKKYVGTDLGFNVLVRPVMYDAYHGVEVYSKVQPTGETEVVSVVGNICESGDAIANERELPVVNEGDIICAIDAGAYGFAMSSNYNNRQRPAEVLIKTNGAVSLIRERDSLEDIAKNMRGIN